MLDQTPQSGPNLLTLIAGELALCAQLHLLLITITCGYLLEGLPLS